MKYRIRGQSLTMTLDQAELGLIVDALETHVLVESDSTEPDEAKLSKLHACIASFREFVKEEHAISI